MVRWFALLVGAVVFVGCSKGGGSAALKDGWSQEKVDQQIAICVQDLQASLDSVGRGAKTQEVCSCYVKQSSEQFPFAQFDKPNNEEWQAQKQVINGCLEASGVPSHFRFGWSSLSLRAPSQDVSRRDRFRQRAEELRKAHEAPKPKEAPKPQPMNPPAAKPSHADAAPSQPEPSPERPRVEIPKPVEPEIEESGNFTISEFVLRDPLLDEGSIYGRKSFQALSEPRSASFRNITCNLIKDYTGQLSLSLSFDNRGQEFGTGAKDSLRVDVEKFSDSRHHYHMSGGSPLLTLEDPIVVIYDQDPGTAIEATFTGSEGIDPIEKTEATVTNVVVSGKKVTGHLSLQKLHGHRKSARSKAAPTKYDLPYADIEGDFTCKLDHDARK